MKSKITNTIKNLKSKITKRLGEISIIRYIKTNILFISSIALS